LLIGISTVLVLTLVISIILNAIKMKSIEQADSELYFDMLYTISTGLINADRDLYQAETAVLNINAYAQYLPPEQIKQHVSDYYENCEQALDRIKAAAALAQTNNDLWTEHTTSDGRTFSQVYPAFESQFNSWKTTYNVDANEGDIEAFVTQFLATRDYISDMTDITEDWATHEREEAEAATSKSIYVNAGIFTAIAVILLIITVLIIMAILKTLKKMGEDVRRISSGDFVTKIKTDSMIIEFEEILKGLEHMRHDLRNALVQVIDHAGSVNSKAEVTKTSITTSQKTTTDISSAVSDLATGATAMAEDVQSTSAVTVNMGSSVDNVLESANKNLEMGRQVYDESTKVKNQLEQIKEQDQKNDEMASQVADSVNETAAVVSQITTAAESIISIASQTNLLALNASIEAARAGEAGKGFAVVADNIKDLAGDTNSLAGEITNMLSTISDYSNKNKELTAAIKEAITNETTALEEMSESFNEMQKLLEETEEGNRQIVDLVESMNADKENILNSVESLSSISEENAASTQETSASLMQLDSTMESVVNQAEDLQRIAGELTEGVKYFKVKLPDKK
jgi:methyl-accepting chemotaxis protein